MLNPKKAFIIEATAGLLFTFGGLRDFLWPHFLTIYSRTPTNLEATITLCVGLVLLIVSGRNISKLQHGVPSENEQ